jgi:hypothetical protein
MRKKWIHVKWFLIELIELKIIELKLKSKSSFKRFATIFFWDKKIHLFYRKSRLFWEKNYFSSLDLTDLAKFVGKIAKF